MGCKSLTPTFAMSIIFGILLPTFDVGTDFWSMANTLNFYGDGLFLAGCRSCFGKSIEDLKWNNYNKDSNNNENNKYMKEERKCQVCISDLLPFGDRDGSYCGKYESTLNKINQLQTSKSECVYESWRLDLFPNVNDDKLDRGECEIDDWCCIQRGLNLTGRNVQILSSDSRPSSDKPTNYNCEDSTCLLHLNVLSYYSRTNYTLQAWKDQSDIVYFLGHVGGLMCSHLSVLGYTVLVPILLNVVFTILIWWNDVKKGETKMATLILVIFQCYPQWKVIKYLLNYKDEAKLQREKDVYERDVGTLECFCESVIQVPT